MNTKKYGKENVKFKNIGILTCNIEELETYDLILLKDVIMHWSNKHIREIIPQIKKKCKFLLITNDNNQLYDNQDTHLGGFRGISYKMRPINEFDIKLVFSWCKFAT